MIKYDLLPEQLIYEGTVSESNFFEPDVLSAQQILAVHTNEYWQKLKHLGLSRQEERRSGFPLSHELVQREITINKGTIMAAHFALQNGIAMNIAGGTHHAYSDRAEGFCLLNDFAIAAACLLDQGLVRQILIVDLDVHQGNGTAEIFRNDPRVFTFSMHGKNNYPLHKEQSDLDIPLEDQTPDKVYLNLLDENLKKLIQSVEPDFIFFQSGVDVLQTDKLGRLGLSLEGCKQRDKLVLSTAYQNDIPLVASMGGGYSDEIRVIVEAHTNTFRLAQEIYF